MYQRIIVVRNLGGDTEMRYMPDGTAVTGFSVATSERWTDKQSGQPVEKTTWFRMAVWGKQAESCNEYLKKGSKVLVEGKIQSDPNTGGPKMWTRQDGSVGASFEIKADTVRFLSSKGDSEAVAAGGGESYAPAEDEDDIPF